MKYADAGAFRAALEQRLRSEASTDGPPDPARLSRLRKLVAFERYLIRLHEVAPGQWTLKGGFALELRLDERARTTKDIDLDWTSGEDELVDFLLDAVELDLGDHFAFEVERIEAPPGVEARAQRWRVVARVDGREFETVLLDASFEATSTTAPDRLQLPATLDFADLPTIRVPALSVEQHLAEKVHAYTRRYGPGADIPSSRVKDLVDMVLIAKSLTVGGRPLRAAIDRVFEARGTHPVPEALPEPPAGWSHPWQEQTAGGVVDDDPRQGHVVAARLVDPVLADPAFAGSWSPVEMRWIETASR